MVQACDGGLLWSTDVLPEADDPYGIGFLRYYVLG